MLYIGKYLLSDNCVSATLTDIDDTAVNKTDKSPVLRVNIPVENYR